MCLFEITRAQPRLRMDTRNPHEIQARANAGDGLDRRRADSDDRVFEQTPADEHYLDRRMFDQGDRNRRTVRHHRGLQVIGAAAPMMTNPTVEILATQVLSDNWYVLRKVTFRLRRRDGSWETQTREAHDRGNGATILPYDPSRRTIILTREFRLPTYVNGNLSGMLIEACAGLLDDENAQQCIIRELKRQRPAPGPVFPRRPQASCA
jgi:hypothetical protein